MNKPFVLPTSKMAAYLGVSKDFLRKNKGKIFHPGTHYNRPNGINKDLWIVAEMEKWALNRKVSKEALEVLDSICGI